MSIDNIHPPDTMYQSFQKGDTLYAINFDELSPDLPAPVSIFKASFLDYYQTYNQIPRIEFRVWLNPTCEPSDDEILIIRHKLADAVLEPVEVAAAISELVTAETPDLNLESFDEALRTKPRDQILVEKLGGFIAVRNFEHRLSR